MKQPIYVVSNEDIVESIQAVLRAGLNAPSQWAWHEPVVMQAALLVLKTRAPGLYDVSTVCRQIHDMETSKMGAQANRALRRLLYEVKRRRKLYEANPPVVVPGGQ